MNRADCIRLQHMLDAAEEAQSFASDRTRRTLLAVMKEIEIIGEAANKVTPETRASHPEIPWTQIIGMRNRLIHGYFDIDPEIVWQTLVRDLPPLIAALRQALATS